MRMLGLVVGIGVMGGLISIAAPAMTEHQQDVAAWRSTRVGRLTAADGWLSLVGLHWVRSGEAQTLGNGDGNDVDLGLGPKRLGTLQWADGEARFVVAADASVTVAGQPVTNVDLEISAGNASVVMAFGSASVQLIKRGEKYALRVKDSESAARAGFTGISYFDIDPSWRIDARFETHPEPRTIEIATVVGTIEEYPNPGRIVFERDGKTYALEALVEEGEAQYFLIMADRSSGKETYGMARYLYAGPPVDGHIVVDFNKAYNPPCAFTAFATCPMPPAGNRLDLYVSAGEKTYGKPH